MVAKGTKMSKESRIKMSEARRGMKHSEETKKRMSGKIPWNKGKKDVMPTPWSKGKTKYNDERLMLVSKKISKAQTGKPRRGNPKNWKHTDDTKKKISEIQKGIRNSPKTEFKKGMTPWNKGKKYLKITGEKHYNWRGGLSSKATKIRTSAEMRLWRNSVFARDNWTCQGCGDNSGGNLNAHHIKSFADYPELRFAIDNGVTLCLDCHKKTESYGVNKNG